MPTLPELPERDAYMQSPGLDGPLEVSYTFQEVGFKNFCQCYAPLVSSPYAKLEQKDHDTT